MRRSLRVLRSRYSSQVNQGYRLCEPSKLQINFAFTRANFTFRRRMKQGIARDMRTWLTGRSPRQIYFAVAGIAVVVVAAVVIFWRYEDSKLAQRPAPPSIPVSVAQAAQADVPIYYDALGTVQALNTVAIRAQVTGQLVSVRSE